LLRAVDALPKGSKHSQNLQQQIAPVKRFLSMLQGGWSREAGPVKHAEKEARQVLEFYGNLRF
jgi:hypothetical protein